MSVTPEEPERAENLEVSTCVPTNLPSYLANLYSDPRKQPVFHDFAAFIAPFDDGRIIEPFVDLVESHIPFPELRSVEGAVDVIICNGYNLLFLLHPRDYIQDLGIKEDKNSQRDSMQVARRTLFEIVMDLLDHSGLEIIQGQGKGREDFLQIKWKQGKQEIHIRKAPLLITLITGYAFNQKNGLEELLVDGDPLLLRHNPNDGFFELNGSVGKVTVPVPEGSILFHMDLFCFIRNGLFKYGFG
jgi:hypothetical protein